MNRIDELVNRELDGELSENERLELERCRDPEVVSTRRRWHHARSALESESSPPSMLEARLAQGVRLRQSVRDVATPRDVRWAWLPAAVLAAFAVAVVLLPDETPTVEGEETVSALVTSTGPVEIQVADSTEPLEGDDDLVVVTF
ncbi:MAG: hypothetical protein AAFX94_04225 [Myxococcota bacterium]